MQETWVQSLGREDPLEEGMASHSSILAWRIPMARGAWRAAVHESDTTKLLSTVQCPWVTLGIFSHSCFVFVLICMFKPRLSFQHAVMH